MIKPVMTPRRAAAELRTETGRGVACGLLFGRERNGLENDDIALADTMVQVPLNPAFSSLSLPQAVLLIAYEWFQAGSEAPPEELVLGRTQPAGKGELLYFFERLEGMLDATGFFPVADKRPGHDPQHPQHLPAPAPDRAGAADPARHPDRAGGGAARPGVRNEAQKFDKSGRNPYSPATFR